MPKNGDCYIGFPCSEELHNEIHRRAKRDDRSVSAWMRDRIGLIFDVDDQLNRDRRRSARHALTSQT